MDLEQCLQLASASSGGAVIEAPTTEEVEALLDFTRAVAHASERRAAPLAAYAVGVAWTGRGAAERVRLLRASAAAIGAATSEATEGAPR